MATRRTLLLAALLLPTTVAADWPHPRGPATDGRIATDGTFSADGIGLELVWRTVTGSGYSSPTVVDGRVISAFSDAEANWIAAHDAASGRELWRHRLGDLYRGHDGSDDGPLSSPVVGDGRVFAIDPRGRLAAVGLADGKPRWERDLAADLGGKKPGFGFTTTPVIADEVLVVLTGGGEGRTVVGLDSTSGDTVWAHGAGEIEYQSPAVMTLAGRRQVVAVSSQSIVGLDPADGTVLWRHALGEDDRGRSAMPTFIGEDRFLVHLSGQVAAFRVATTGEGFSVEPLYRSDAIGRTYANPVYHGGHVYGFRGAILTCMDAATGERVWRSRPPGGDGLILVDDHLVIFAAKGQVVVADATPEGYRERARVEALGGSSLSWPAFAGGRVFVRNLEEMAAVTITDGATAAASVAEATAAKHEFGRWLERARASDDPAAAVDELFQRHPETPIAEGDFIHFVYRGAAEQVVIGGSLLDQSETLPLERLADTDFFYRTFELEAGARWEYHFVADFGEPVTDPRNPRTVPAIDGDRRMSEVTTEGYRRGDHLAEPTGPRGNVETFTWNHPELDGEREVTVWLPPAYSAEAGGPYPLLVVNRASYWLERAELVKALDNLVGERMAPAVVAFVPAARRWWTDAGGENAQGYADAVATGLVPTLAKRYRISDDAADRALLGNRYFGLGTAYTALRHHGVFGRVAIQSPSLDLGVGDELRQMIASGRGKSVDFYLDWNRYDERRRDRGYDFGADGKELWGLLTEAGYDVTGGEQLDSAGWGGWRNRLDVLLATLFPVGT